MAFKSFSQYQEEKQGEFFLLPNDGDYADVVFLYRSPEDVLVADVHYIKSSTYNGYAHCCEAGCPACAFRTARGGRISLDHKIFIPLYNITKGKVEFWDRSTYFESTLQTNVFKNFPNPSETVFRITRRGAARSRDTTYDIDPIARNSSMPYEKILADAGMTLPEGYSKVVREMSISEMDAALNSSGTGDLQDYGYVPTPRGGAVAESPHVASQPVDYSMPPSDLPPMPEIDSTQSLSDMPEYNPDSATDLVNDSDGNLALSESDDLDNVDF